VSATIQPPARSRADRDREVVQRTAELLTSDLTLEELFLAVCSLLARFVDASIVFIALRDREGANIAFMLRDGAMGRPENARVRPGSRTAEILRTGRAILKRRAEDWTEERVPVYLPGQDERTPLSAIFVPLKYGPEIIGALSVQSLQPDAYDEEDVALLQTCALYLSVRIHQFHIETRSAQLQNIASTDSVTGVPNRRSFNERFPTEWRRAVRRSTSVAVLLIDVDFFKLFNDTYGHVAGDAALLQVASALKSCLSRPEDCFARYGGEEFVAVLPGTSLSGALTVAERMREAVFDLGIAHSGSLLRRLTISAGVACRVPARGVQPETLIEAADAALYAAKRSGRNRVAAENYHSDAPPVYAAKACRHNLPALRGEAVCRHDAKQQIRKLLRAARLVTIAGPAGLGKSHEAIAAARREFDRFPDGVFYVDCSPVTGETDLLAKIAAVVGAPETPLVRPGAAVAEFLQAKRTLLVLDGCDAVAKEAGIFACELTAHARESRVLVTAREPLMVSGEVAFVLSPLSADEAAALFCERTPPGMVREPEDTALVWEICRRLDGLPRAIELAAAQLRTLGLASLVDRLPDRAALGREAMRGFVEWSYNVLSPEEQTQLRGLSVFAGGASPEAVLEVAGARDMLLPLVEKTLVSLDVSQGAPRYALPASVRSFVLEKSDAQAESHERALRHARYFAKRARDLDAAYSTKKWRALLEAMLPEIDNLNAALSFTIVQGGGPRLGAEIACAAINFWQQTGRNRLGREWMELLLARGDDAYPKALAAKLSWGLARLDWGRSKRGLESALRAVALYRELGDELGLARALYEAAACTSASGNVDGSGPMLDESLEIARQLGQLRLCADVLNSKGIAETWRGDHRRARELLEAALALFRQLEDDHGIALILGNLGDLSATIGQHDRAVAFTRQSLATLERLHDAQATGWQLINLGSFELKRGNVEAARPALHRGLELVREYQDDWLSANALDCLARLAICEQEWERALRLTGFADGILESLGLPRQPADQREYEYVVREAQLAIGRQSAMELMRQAGSMAWPEAVNEALAQ
jgi:diguanylate cyclase (GGDEF)-like protein